MRLYADVYGYEELIPTHQGSGAEHLLSQILINPGDVVPGNMYFTTTRYHQERAGGRFVDVIVDEAHDPEAMHPFKGNIDLEKLAAVVEPGTGQTGSRTSRSRRTSTWPAVSQLSMANLKEVYEYCNGASGYS